MNSIHIKPEIISWAAERSQIDGDVLRTRFKHFDDWTSGEKQPTFKQLEKFAKATYTPFGYLFLPEPPTEPMPIQDFRTVRDTGVRRPSPGLLDTIYAMQRRQDWLRDECIENGNESLTFVGSARLQDDPTAIGQKMRRLLGVNDGWASSVVNWKEAVSELRRRIETLGVLAIINGVVGNNTHRKLDVGEFRGFALTDPYAPLIFINGADAKSAQMFTLAHELAHIWLGPEGEGVSGYEGLFPGDNRVEQFCNQAAAEFLVPARELRERWFEVRNASDKFDRIARYFKVSPIVAARRTMDIGLVNREEFFGYYKTYTQREREQTKTSDGGDFYNSQNQRVGERFATLVVGAAMEGRITFKNAYDLTDLRGGAFQVYARRLGMDLP